MLSSRSRHSASVSSHRDSYPRSLSSFPSSILSKIKAHTSAEWSRATNAFIHSHFQRAYKNVPAYRRFLDKSGLDGASIRRPEDVKRVPPVSKGNYLRLHPWQDLCQVNALANVPLVLTATSGSTGQSFYIPRADEVHDASMISHHLFLERSGLDKSQPTLVMVVFGMGVWIGGLLTYEAFRRISENSWPLTLITPGVNKKEIFDVLLHIAPEYKQLVICGYPPFVKDLIDDAPSHGINWKQWDVRIVCAAEAFSEYFREHLMERTGMSDPYRSVMNIYGSAELGTMATETPLSILLRRLAIRNENLYKKLFTDAHRLPTFAQFVPDLISFEAGEDGKIYVTGGAALPLVRYDIGDQGGVLTYADVERACREVGVDLLAEIQKAGIGQAHTELPFVYIYERADLSTKLYGAIIYPEHVKVGLQNSAFERAITGRFTMTTEHDAEHNEYLEINIELQNGAKEDPGLRESLTKSIIESLVKLSGEYSNNYTNMGDRVSPRPVLWPHEDPKYFPAGIKQKWVIQA